jgi:hypothetical protein
MTDTFKIVPVVDSVLDCKESIPYAVYRSGANITFSQNPVSGQATPSSQNYNIIVPSEQTVVSRYVDWTATLNFTVNFPAQPNFPTNIPNFLQYGINCALCAYPLHSSVTTMSATLNNNTFSQDQDVIMQPLIRMLDKELQGKFNDTTCVMPDNYLNYSDALNAINNPLGAYNNSVSSNDFHPRGSFVLKAFNTTGYADGLNQTISSATMATTGLKLYVSVKVTEPLMLSPFLFQKLHSNQQGFYGIQNMNIRMNTNPNYPLLRWAGASTYTQVPTVSLDAENGYQGAELRLKYLTTKPEDQFPARNSVGYYSMEKYITSGSAVINAGSIAPITAQNLQLNMIPDKVIIFARRKNNNSILKSDSYLVIKGIDINFANNAGILSSATQEDLWRMSKEAGVNQSWLDWSGYANSANLNAQGKIPLIGSMLVLDFARHIQITESYYSPGSLGVFSFQYKVQLENQSGQNLNSGDYELVTVIMNSGVCSLMKGSCSVFQGILTKSDVLSASTMPKAYTTDVERMVGGQFLDNLKSVVGSALVKGRGESGGAMSAGAMSGGSFPKKSSKMSDRIKA